MGFVYIFYLSLTAKERAHIRNTREVFSVYTFKFVVMVLLWAHIDRCERDESCLGPNIPWLFFVTSVTYCAGKGLVDDATSLMSKGSNVHATSARETKERRIVVQQRTCSRQDGSWRFAYKFSRNMTCPFIQLMEISHKPLALQLVV